MTLEQIMQDLPSRFMPERFEADDPLTVHLFFDGEEGPRYSVSIDFESCQVKEGIHGIPSCEVRTASQTYIDIETGKTNANMAFLMGKIKLSDVSVMLAFVKCFRRD